MKENFVYLFIFMLILIIGFLILIIETYIGWKFFIWFSGRFAEKIGDVITYGIRQK